MPTLELVNICCLQTEDSGEDEIYITLNDKRVWGPISINEGGKDSTKTINIKKLFANRIIIRLYDEDSGVFEDDDYLGKLTVKSSHADPNGKERDHTFRRDDAEYRLTYRVFAAPSKSERRTLRIKKLATTSTETE